MEMTMKTKEVSEQLGVNPTTIQRWAKYFGLECETNEHGHYLYTATHLEIFRNVQDQLKEGKRMKDIQFEGGERHKQEKTEFIETSVYEEKLEAVLSRVNELDEKVSQKADEVVSYQLLKHRTELEDMMKMIKKLETRLSEMEHKVHQSSHSNGDEQELPMVVGGNSVKTKKWRSFKQLFSF
ncbi:chromosome-anchoring protein RacA [Alkalihalobacillus sp. MEB130]|uniref:chromosome-anchoring protein RacA n=1 Tax=Alkalihalobacillus sp. MEB130 TaxID=2976704 RepID=UPI0028DED7FE|nr:chromosome-anchoring protein RacA [Alkalihalobacillus sp. MEB130]MDT8859963.1 chromosome-anchoring protein RacA [Alkalihalobacillus sp. MEB130]